MVYLCIFTDVFISVNERPAFVFNSITGEISIISKLPGVNSERTDCVLFSLSLIRFSHTAYGITAYLSMAGSTLSLRKFPHESKNLVYYITSFVI